MKKRTSSQPLIELGNREREIMEVVYELEGATVAEVREGLAKPPSYSAVRTMLGKLEEKGLLRHHEDGPRYIYEATVPVDKARQSTLRKVTEGLFGGSSVALVASLLSDEESDISPEDLMELERMVRRKRKEGK